MAFDRSSLAPMPCDAEQPEEAFPLDPEALAREIEIPLDRWAGNCHGISQAVLTHLPVRGMRLMRGHYDGPVRTSSIFRGGVSQHSWLEAADGRILDPTRWCFDSPSKPYIYLGPCDHYDAGGFALRAGFPPPMPGRSPDFSEKIDALAPHRRAELAGLLGIRAEMQDAVGADILSRALLIALKQDPDSLDSPAALYGIVLEMGLGAMIQADARQRVLEPEKITARENANRFFRLPEAEQLSPRILIARLLLAFVMIETRPGLEEELAEHDITLDAYWDALTRLEKDRETPLRHFTSEEQYILGIVLGDILGQGFGTALRVERYAKSLGYDRTALTAALDHVGRAFRICLAW